MGNKALPTITAVNEINAVIVLSDGTYFFGKGVGSKGETIGEICFNTGITGYQETLTDPSYAGQIITFTFPHIGNIGCNSEDMEAKEVFCRGLVIRDAITQDSNFRSEQHLNTWLVEQNLIGISEVDTRALTRNIRHKGARNAIIAHVEEGSTLDVQELVNKIKDLPTLEGTELAATVTTKETYEWDEHSFDLENGYKKAQTAQYHVVTIDYGIKHNILRCLVDAGLKVTVVPSTASFDEIMKHQPDGIFLSNGPGDPFATGQYAAPVIQQLLEVNIPIFGICLGNQLLAIASGLKTEKMHQGHRGANHPVKSLKNNTVEITSQNHGFCISDTNIPENVEVTHLSLFDHTIEGIRRKDKHAYSVQYHPESSPGPHDSRYLFKEFIKLIELAKQQAA
jgi:carbamoyl-phosphate synthase small subunit